MAESTVPTKEVLLKHLATVSKESVDNQAGKLGCNPYLWVKRTVNPLAVEVEQAKDITKPLADKVLAVKALPKPAEAKKA